MIKKVILLFFILFNFIFLTYSENLIDLTGDMFFYIPGEEHITDYQNFYDYLKQWDENKIIVSDEKLLKFYKDFVGQKTLHGLLFEAFLRQTKNEKIRKQVLFLIKGNKFNDIFSQTLIRLYNSRKRQIDKGGKKHIQYYYKNDYFDENINLFNQAQKLFFENELGLMTFDNTWTKKNYIRPDKEEVDKEGFYLTYNGGTNSLGVYIYKFPNIKFEEFRNKEIYSKYSFERYEWHGKVKELERTGILKKSNADKIFINYGFGNSDWLHGEGESILFTIFIYNEKLQRGYSVSYFMDISKINNNYEMRNRIWSQLLMQLLFCYINVK